MPDADSMRARYELAIQIARDGGALTLKHFYGRDFSVEKKSDGSVVTIADRDTEAFMRRMITDAFPDDGILGEEHDDVVGSSGVRWILDPIDGTKSFVHGVPLYGNLIAVEADAEIQIGVINMPALGEMVHAMLGSGAWHETADGKKRAAKVSGVDDARDAVLVMTAYDYFAVVGQAELYERLAQAFGASRGWSDCYGQLLVATGRAEMCVEPYLNPWDIAPMLPIIAEAGGRYSDWHGKLTTYSSHGITSNGHLHDVGLQLVEGCEPTEPQFDKPG